MTALNGSEPQNEQITQIILEISVKSYYNYILGV